MKLSGLPKEMLSIKHVRNYLISFDFFQLTGEVTLQIANEPVLPFNALDIALEVQNSLKGNFHTAIVISANMRGGKKVHLLSNTETSNFRINNTC